MFEYTTYIPPGPHQYIFVNYPTEFHSNIKTIIIKPRQRDIKIGASPDLKIRKNKKKFFVEETVFREFKPTSDEEFKLACENDFKFS